MRDATAPAGFYARARTGVDDDPQPDPDLPPVWRLDAVPESVSAARRAVAAHLDAIEILPPERAAELVLLVSEMTTNAIRYGSEPGDCIQIILMSDETGVRVEVHDTNRRPPRFKPESEERQRGRGLYLLQALADRWGTGPRVFGKYVWAEIDRR